MRSEKNMFSKKKFPTYRNFFRLSPEPHIFFIWPYIATDGKPVSEKVILESSCGWSSLTVFRTASLTKLFILVFFFFFFGLKLLSC